MMSFLLNIYKVSSISLLPAKKSGFSIGQCKPTLAKMTLRKMLRCHIDG
jgi:hypothetical protein